MELYSNVLQISKFVNGLKSLFERINEKINISSEDKKKLDKILNYFQSREIILFNDLLTSDKREEKLLTLVPLLHLDHQKKLNLDQKVPFGDIEITRFKEQ